MKKRIKIFTTDGEYNHSVICGDSIKTYLYDIGNKESFVYKDSVGYFQGKYLEMVSIV